MIAAGFGTFNGYIGKGLNWLGSMGTDGGKYELGNGGAIMNERFDAWRLGLGSWIRSGSKDRGECVGSMKRTRV